MNFYNKDRNNTTKLLANALASEKEKNNDTEGMRTPFFQPNQQKDNLFENNDFFGNNANTNEFLQSGEIIGSMLPYGNIAMSGVNAGNTALNGGSWDKDVPQSFFGIDQNSSDTNQAIDGAMKGAQMGATFGPYGTVIGAALGLGSSFLDDL